MESIENNIENIEKELGQMKSVIKKYRKNDEGGGGGVSSSSSGVSNEPSVIFFDDEQSNVDDMAKNVKNCRSILIKCPNASRQKIIDYMDSFHISTDFDNINNYHSLYEEKTSEEERIQKYCGGIDENTVKTLEYWLQKQHIPIVVFDWDKTLSMFDGLIFPNKIPYKTTEEFRTDRELYEKLKKANHKIISINPLVTDHIRLSTFFDNNMDINYDSDDEYTAELPYLPIEYTVEEKRFVSDMANFVLGKEERINMLTTMFLNIRKNPNAKICIITRNPLASKSNPDQRSLFLKMIKIIDPSFVDENLFYCPANINKSEVFNDHIGQILGKKMGGRKHTRKQKPRKRQRMYKTRCRQ